MAVDRDGQDATGYMGVNPSERPKNVLAQRAPTATDRRHKIGTLWIDRTNNQSYQLTNVLAGSANWTLLGPGASDVDTLTGDSGGAISPAAGNITLAGGTNITSAGAGSTVTFNLDAAISLATSVTAPLFTAGAGVDLDLTAPTGQDAVLKLGDASAANKLSITDSADAEIASVDSNGAAIFVLSVQAPLYTAGAGVDLDITVPSGQDAVLKLGDASAANKLSLTDSADVEVAQVNSDGAAQFDSTVTAGGDIIMSSVATKLQMNGGAVTDFIGQSTLVSGTVTVANTNIAANDRIFLTRADENSSSALGMLTITAQTASTSFVITALDPSDGSTTITGDVSVVNWFIVRQN